MILYNQDYQLTGINTGAGTIQNLTNGYDLAGNITAITDNPISGRTQTLTYDNAQPRRLGERRLWRAELHL